MENLKSIMIIILSVIIISHNLKNHNNDREIEKKLDKEKFELSLELGKSMYENIFLDQKEGELNFKKIDSLFEIQKQKMSNKIY